ncbi:MAG: TIGR03756 family integrating conjugative element protein [Gammaproteobacteria bacterium]|nr:TIGR03756 family integrating conjugative element protein [Gammaproteobacteria bacterium]MCP5135385.1 TIGR03756 family integrating conjugative element protein [Gammaproteobacteria bacterium]
MNARRRGRQTRALVLVLSIAGTPSFAGTFNTLDLAERSANVDCLNWCVVGICFWLVCTPFPPSCSIQTTPQIRHNLPDLVATVYEQPGETPWDELRATLGQASDAGLNAITNALLGVDAGGGGYLEDSEGLNGPSQMRFKEASVIGNPIAYAATRNNRFLCRSKAEPFFPYFVSELDALAWRSGLPDSLSLEAVTPGLREIGPDVIRSWSSVYPRSGFMHQADDARAGAVAAQRAMDVTTRTGQPHIYTPYGWDGPQEMVWGDRFAQTRDDCEATGGSWDEVADNVWQCAEQRSVQWLPGSDEDTDQWQMISPVDSGRCGPFGDPSDWSDPSYQSDDGRYAWLYWRPYQCCIPGPGIFLTSVPTPEICLQ